MYFVVRINIFIFSSLIFSAVSKELIERYHWNVIDFQFESPGSRQEAIKTNQYMPENCIPSGLEVWKDKVFVSIPRYKPGIPSTLNYINLNTSEKSPLLIPYPSWNDNNLQTGTLKSLHHLNVDQCERLWSVDDSPESDISPHPMLIIINLKTDSIQKYNLTKDTVHDSSFTNIIVDVDATNCNNAFAYIADSRGAGLVVYSLKDNNSRRISHPFFSYDPLSTNFHINDIKYHLPLGIIGLTLSNKKPNGYKDLFFHPGASNNIFYVSTQVLRDSPIVVHEEFKVLGDKGKDLQSYTSYFHPSSEILFYNIINKNAIGCWNSRKFPREFSDATNDIAIKNDTSLVFVIDLRGDSDGNLWLMSNKMPLLAKKGFNKDEINFRIFFVDVKNLVDGTVCEETRKKNKTLVSASTYY